MLCNFKNTVEEDVQKRRKASLQRMSSVGAAEEVRDEENDGCDYDDEDFEVHVYSCVAWGEFHNT